MAAESGVVLASVAEGSPADALGLRPGDRLLRANGHPVRDVIDFLFESGEEEVRLEFEGPGAGRVEAVLPGGTDFGLELELPRTRTCRNKCIFCFVSQLPRGLRGTLYVKDEDYRFSFLFGNYITLSNLSRADRERILEQRLSPLYVSVHSVDPVKRRILLGPNAVPDIIGELKTLIRGGIRLHTQVVMCPGINDGSDLDRTIRALARLFPGVESLAVVPVGLTRFHRNNLVPVDRALAQQTVARIEGQMERFDTKMGTPFVYPSDELYLKAGRDVPPARVYGEFVQIENGVGLLRDFLDRAAALRLPKRLARRVHAVTFTGRSFRPYLERTARKMASRIAGVHLEVLEIENRFFGPEVTVAGLLTGRDVIGRLREAAGDTVLIPDVVLRDGQDVFLDDTTVADLERQTAKRARVIDATPEGLLQGLREAARRA